MTGIKKIIFYTISKTGIESSLGKEKLYKKKRFTIPNYGSNRYKKLHILHQVWPQPV